MAARRSNADAGTRAARKGSRGKKKGAASGGGSRTKAGKGGGGKKSRARKKSARKKSSASAKRTPPPPSRSWTSAVTDRLSEMVELAAVGVLRRAIDAGGREIGAWLPESTEMRVQAGSYLRELRELAGLTIDELAEAVDLSDRSVLEAVESGTATISFELILRLAAILARHDPAPFVARLVRTYNPVLWQVLEDWGLGRLPLQGAREREFVNVLRANDAARELSDEDFDRVLTFTREAFETALHFASKSKGRAPRRRRPSD